MSPTQQLRLDVHKSTEKSQAQLACHRVNPLDHVGSPKMQCVRLAPVHDVRVEYSKLLASALTHCCNPAATLANGFGRFTTFRRYRTRELIVVD